MEQQSRTLYQGDQPDLRQDLLALHALAPLSSTYLPWTQSTMRPSGITTVLNEIVLNRRRCIVELGSGVSSVYMGRLLHAIGGHLWTVEHDGHWAETTERLVADEALTEVVTVVRAPLVPTSSAWEDQDDCWYDEDRLKDLTAGQRIDLLVVDGPPAYEDGKEHARYPALPFFAPMLAEDHTVIIDDIDRPGERHCMKRWERELGMTFERYFPGRVGIGRPRATAPRITDIHVY